VEKIKTTKKHIQDNFTKIVSVGYCNLQTLLKWHEPVAYTSGVYGWNFDVYDINGVAIVTGYRNAPKNKGVKCDYETIVRYEDEARKIQRSSDWRSEQKKLDALLNQFIDEITTF